MSATKILWGQILIVSAIVLATTWGATEWVAWRLAFQPELGPPWFRLFGFPFYLPPSFFWWWYGFDAYAPAIFVEGAYIAASGGFASVSTESESSAGQGYPPTWQVRRHGIPVSLSMDTSVWWSGDLFSAMRTTRSPRAAA